MNEISNTLLPNWGARVAVRKYAVERTAINWEVFYRKSSPSRLWTDLFLSALPWDRIATMLGGIHVLDIGCGRGHYSATLQSLSGNRIESYCGIDRCRRPEWERLSADSKCTRFIQDTCEHIEDITPPETNLIISISALEHFEHDLKCMRGLATFAARNKRPLLQLHFLPSAACLPLYRYHGVRQYTPRTLRKLAHVFEAKTSEAVIIALGGPNGNALHQEYITSPMCSHGPLGDLRDANSEEYWRLLQQAVLSDTEESRPIDPSFYVLAITTRCGGFPPISLSGNTGGKAGRWA